MAKTLRDVYGESLVKYGKENENVVVLDADVCSSTKSGLFGAAYPERFFNVGIAEADMVGIAAGLATTGKVPFINTFAVFLTSIGLIGARAFGSYSKLNMKFMGAYGGISDAYDGPSHHSLEDISIMRALPNFQVFVAADEYQTDWLVKNAIEVDAPMYIRLSRDATLTVYNEDTKFETGKGKVIREGKDATIIACGVMVGQAVAAAEELAKKGIEVRVVDMFCIKPIDRELILESAAKTGAIITAEEHSIIGGLGGAVAEVLSSVGAQVVQEFVGLQDCHAECGDYRQLLAKYGLDVPALVSAVEKAMTRK
ncbi:transketolase C-terminal domain-containing protein [Oscillospiraceae bacterium PP1C4]